MSLTIALQSAISSLQASQLALQVTSNNVSNANTLGYTRKAVSQESRVLDGMGAGVSATDILRRIDPFIQDELRLQLGNSGQYDVLNSFYEQMQNLLGSLTKGTSFVSGIDTFANALQALAVSPENVSMRSDAINAAKTLTDLLGNLGHDLQNLRRQADKLIADSVSTINDQLALIYDLNHAIAHNIAVGVPSGELEDQRDAAIAKIAKEMDISFFTRENGEVVILTSNGRTLLDREVRPLSHDPASNMSASISHADGGVPGIYLDGVDITDEIRAGRIGGAIEIRDQKVPDLVAELDRLAAALRDQINAVHNDGTAFPPPNSLTGTHQFAAGDVLVAAGSLRIAVLDSSGAYADDGLGGPAYADIDLSALTQAAGGTLTVQNVIDAINGGIIAGFDGVPGATASLVGGNLVIKADNPAYGVVVDGSNVDGSLGTNGSVDASGVTLGGDITAFPAPTVSLATSGISEAAGAELEALLVGGQLTLGLETTAGAPGALQLSANAKLAFGPVGGGAGSSLGLAVNTASGDIAGGGTVEVAIDSDGDGLGDTVIGTLTFGAATLAGVTAGGAQGSIAIQGIDYSRDTAVTVASSTQSFGQYFGLNDFFVTGANYDDYASAPQTSATSAFGLAGTLTFSGSFGSTTVNYAGGDDLQAIAAAINADPTLSAANVEASVITEGSRVRLRILDTDGDNFTLTDGGQLLSALGVGINTANALQDLRVRETLALNPALVSRGELDASTTPAAGTVVVTAGDNAAVQRMANAFTGEPDFGAAGSMAAMTSTFAGYGAAILSLNAVEAGNIASNQTFRQQLVQDLETKLAAVSGVNIDEELANMILFQNAYNASARVIATAIEMFKTLDDMMSRV